MRRRPLRLFLVLQLSPNAPLFRLETSRQTHCTSTFVPSPSRSRSTLLFFEREGRGGGGTQCQPHPVYPTIISRRRNNKQLRSFLGLHLLWHRCPCPLDFIHLLGEDGVAAAAAAGGNAKSQMPLRQSAERRCRRRAHSETHSWLWRSTMEESPEQLNHPTVQSRKKDLEEHLNLLLISTGETVI